MKSKHPTTAFSHPVHSYIQYLAATIIIDNTSETTFGLLDLSSSVLCCMAEGKVPPDPLTTDCIVPAYK